MSESGDSTQTHQQFHWLTATANTSCIFTLRELRWYIAKEVSNISVSYGLGLGAVGFCCHNGTARSSRFRYTSSATMVPFQFRRRFFEFRLLFKFNFLFACRLLLMSYLLCHTCSYKALNLGRVNVATLALANLHSTQ